MRIALQLPWRGGHSRSRWAECRSAPDPSTTGGLEQLLARADPAQPEQLQEAAVDGLCKLAANHPPAKDAAAAAGAIPRLAALLTSGSSGSGSSSGPEVQVRALLALGMLAGGSPERQLELAGAPGAVAALLRLMRQQDDADMQQIAAGALGWGEDGCAAATQQHACWL